MNLVTSTPNDALKSIISSMEHHKKEFKEEADLAFHKQMAGNHENQTSETVLRSPSAPGKKSFLVVERKDPKFTGRDEVLEDIHKKMGATKTSELAEATSYLYMGSAALAKRQRH